MPPKVLLDANIPPVVATTLAGLGVDARAASGDRALEALDDRSLLLKATADGRVLTTFNVRDFDQIARELAVTGVPHAGIVLISSRTFRPTAVGVIARSLAELLKARPDFRNLVLFLPRPSG